MLFLVEPILHEVGPVLCEILHTHNLHYPNNIASKGKSEQIGTWLLNLSFQYNHDDVVANLSN